MTLHDAIVEVFSAAGVAMTATSIAAEINRLGLYSRRDGSSLPANQISARVHNYSQLFTNSGGLIRLKEETPPRH